MEPKKSLINLTLSKNGVFFAKKYRIHPIYFLGPLKYLLIINNNREERTEIAESKMPHPLHEEHLPLFQNIGTEIEGVEEIVRNPKFIWKNCGRAATNEKTFAHLKDHDLIYY